MEIWKDIPDYEGIYQVSNLGNVKSLSRTFLRENKMLINWKERPLKPSMSSNGKLTVNLYKDKKGKLFQVHQLVAMAFLNHKPNGLKWVVDHIDNNPINNKLENLQIITQRENSSKDVRKGSSDYIGVSWISKRKKYQATIQIKGRSVNLGCYINEIDAHNAYQNKLKTLSP